VHQTAAARVRASGAITTSVTAAGEPRWVDLPSPIALYLRVYRRWTTTLRRSLIWLAIGFFSVCAFAAFVYAHGGGLDAYGCHNNRKAGGYHCHRGP
jgi:hypothetical protein